MKIRKTRRDFLAHTGIAMLASSQIGVLSRAAHADVTEGYRAMVCILLAGGADSFNMLLPYDQSRYDAYAAVRSDLALAREDVLPLNYAGGQGEAFAVHPGLGEVQQMFDAGDLAFIANIGPLAEPTSRAAFDSAQVRLPLGLFSHSDQIAVWQTAAAGERIFTGFGGRIADLVESQVNTGPVSMNISMSGNSLFQTGNAAAGYVMDAADGVRTVGGYDDPSNTALISAIDSMLDVDYQDAFRQSYAQLMRGSLDAGRELSAALQNTLALSTSFSAGGLSEALAQVANVISIRDQLGVSRQTFFITIGGWDHHDEVLENQANMLPGISRGLFEFQAAMTEMGIADAVTTFTISDFCRTLTSNGRGSDHGWGGHNLIMGGGLNGGQIFGDYPDLTPGGELDVGRGRYLPTTSVDEMYAELAIWFGIEPGNVATVLPNIGRFYDPVTESPRLGLFG